LYIAHATGPQLITGVRRNASTALRHTYRVAFTDRDAGSINIRAMELGISPRNPIARAYYLVHGKFLNRRPTKNISPRAFRVKHEEGQLHIEPRHRHIPKLQEKQCPATYAKVATAEGQRPALLLFMETIGRVAVDEIYPQYFDITRDRLA
ncbi:MAG TPA: hypothetical protein VFT58_01695, partial [Nitrososphaera sp.]|nr:hypothetical protein [Nitrososphaera sp.]